MMNVSTPVDADYLIYRLEEAGATLLALPGSGWSTRLRGSSIEIVRTALEAVSYTHLDVYKRQDIDSAPWRDEFYSAVPAIENGEFVLPKGPGWGIDVNEKAVQARPPKH